MSYDVLYNFISPVTGRILADEEDYILVGDENGIAIPSPALIDIKLDFIKIRHVLNEIVNTGFIIESDNFNLPKAQVLDHLDDGFMYNTGGIISTTNTTPLPHLEYKHLWIGDSNNDPQAVTTIDIDNLPSLGTTSIPTPTGGFVGKVWEGTASGRPEESSIVGEMFADITLLNAKFLAGKFVMNSGLTASFPKAQFLNALTAGGLVKTSSTGDGKLETVTLEQDQILMGGVNNEPESRARIGAENLPNLTNNMVWQGNAEGRPEEVELNFASSDAKYIIQQESLELANAQVLGALTTGILKNTTITGVLSIASGGGAVGVDDYVTPLALEEAIEAQAEATTIEIAEAIEAQAVITTAEIAASAIATEAAAYAAFQAEMLPFIGIPPITIGEEIVAAIGASEVAANAYTNSAISGLTVSLDGDISGSGSLSSTINTTFTPNPVFAGNESMTIPFGTTSQRPSNSNIGMIRINTEI